VILGVPTGGSPKIGFYDASMRDMKMGLFKNWITASGIYLENNRNNLVANFLKGFPEEQWLCQIDDDIYWDAVVIPYLMEQAKGKGESYDKPEHLVIFPDVSLGAAPTSAHTWNGRDFVPLWPHPSKEPFLCDGMAGAFMLVHRDVYEMLPEWSWFERRNVNGARAGEDLSFCYLLRERGIKCLCVPGLPLLHFRVTPIISPLISIPTAEEQARDNVLPFKKKSVVVGPDGKPMS